MTSPAPGDSGQRDDALIPDDILADLRAVLTERGIERWIDTPMAVLHNATPRQYLAAGDVDAVRAVTRNYLDPGFS